MDLQGVATCTGQRDPVARWRFEGDKRPTRKPLLLSESGSDEIEVPDLDVGYFFERFVIVTMLSVPRKFYR